jgi:hypothetical protein
MTPVGIVLDFYFMYVLLVLKYLLLVQQFIVISFMSHQSQRMSMPQTLGICC